MFKDTAAGDTEPIEGNPFRVNVLGLHHDEIFRNFVNFLANYAKDHWNIIRVAQFDGCCGVQMVLTIAIPFDVRHQVLHRK